MQIDIGPIIGPKGRGKDHIDFNYGKDLKTAGRQLTNSSGEQTMNFNFNFREGTKSKDIYKTTGRRAEQTLTLETQDSWAILEGSIRSTDFSFIEGSKANDRRQLENIWRKGSR